MKSTISSKSFGSSSDIFIGKLRCVTMCCHAGLDVAVGSLSRSMHHMSRVDRRASQPITKSQSPSNTGDRQFKP